MIRPSDSIFIVKQDMEKDLVRKVEINNLIEYWVFQSKDSAMIDQTGAILEGQHTGDRALRCVIVCDNSATHINKEHANHIVVSGVIFSEKDMEDYLMQTGRRI